MTALDRMRAAGAAAALDEIILATATRDDLREIALQLARLVGDLNARVAALEERAAADAKLPKAKPPRP